MQSSPAPKIELDKALRSIDEMEGAATLDDFEEAWKSYLFRLERCFNKAYAHYKKSPKWDAWWGKYKKIRASDDLLSYLRNARGAEEHTVEEIVGREAAGIGIKAAQGDYLHMHSMVFDAQGNATMHADRPIKIIFLPEKMTLLPVLNRGLIYPVPASHLGNPIDMNNVTGIAKLGHSFYSSFIESAERYFVK